MPEQQPVTMQHEIAIGIRNGKVTMHWHKPVNTIDFEAANALQFAEAMARCAYTLHTGKPPPQGASVLAQAVRGKVTDQMRDKMVARIAVMLPSLDRQKHTPGYIAMQLVDTILKEVA